VGGSLVPVGGHNMLEPAMRGKPVLYGPHTSNFREAAAQLERTGGGLVVKDGFELERELARLIEDREEARRVGEAAREAFTDGQGAVAATLELIARHLWPGGVRP
jgi:3-deoxy-D-manno-octulosonic-acid transferase